MIRPGAVWLAIMIALAPGTARAGDDIAEFNAAYARFKELAAAGEAEGAIPFAEKALELGGKLHGPDSREAGILAFSLGNLYATVRDYDKARDVLRRSVTIREKIYGKKAKELIRPLSELGQAFRGQHDFDAAKKAFRRALAIAEKSVGRRELVTADILLNLGQTEYRGSELELAQQHLRRSVRIYEKQAARTDPNYGSALIALSKLTRAKRKRLDYQLQGLTALEATLPPGHRDILVAHAAIIATYEKMRKRNDATQHVLHLARHQGDIEGEPQPIYRVIPVYPVVAARTRQEGYVDIDFTIGVDGMVRDATAVAGENVSTFRRAALECLGKWRYKPKIVNGVPVARKGNLVRIKFELLR